MKISIKSLMTSAVILGSVSATALPIDWEGTLGFDTSIIRNARKTTDRVHLKGPQKHLNFHLKRLIINKS